MGGAMGGVPQRSGMGARAAEQKVVVIGQIHIYDTTGQCSVCGRVAGAPSAPSVPHTGAGPLPYRALVWLWLLRW